LCLQPGPKRPFCAGVDNKLAEIRKFQEQVLLLVQDKALEDGLAKLSEKPAEEDKTNDKLSLAKDNDDELLPKAKVHPVPKFPKWQRKRGGRNNRRKAPPFTCCSLVSSTDVVGSCILAKT